MSRTLPEFLEPCAQLPGQPSTEPAIYLNAVFRHKRIPSLAHCLWWPSDVPSKTCLVFLPGNPGLLDFYTPFLTAIYEKASHKLDILGHASVGHTPAIDRSQEDPSATCLRAQVDAILEIVDTIKPAYTRIVVAGHSAGSWITAQVLKARMSDIDSVFLLFPTIRHIVRTPNGRNYWWAFKTPFPRLLSWASFATRLLPMRILHMLFPDWPDAQLLVLRRFLNSPSSIYTCLMMSHDEMTDIKDLDIDLLRQNKHKIHMYFAEVDLWVGENKAAILREIGAEEENVKIVHGPDDIPHAFCINHGEQIADQCYEWLEEGGFVSVD